MLNNARDQTCRTRRTWIVLADMVAVRAGHQRERLLGPLLCGLVPDAVQHLRERSACAPCGALLPCCFVVLFSAHRLLSTRSLTGHPRHPRCSRYFARQITNGKQRQAQLCSVEVLEFGDESEYVLTPLLPSSPTFRSPPASEFRWMCADRHSVGLGL